MSLENDLNNLNRDKFISLFGVIFEKTKWIAEKLLEHKPFKDKEDLINKMFLIYETTEKNKVLDILRSHPKLAVEKNLTKYSSEEQSRANLKNCTEEQYEEFKMLNFKYEKKFGFPFIIAVKGKDKIEILNNAPLKKFHRFLIVNFSKLGQFSNFFIHISEGFISYP